MAHRIMGSFIHRISEQDHWVITDIGHKQLMKVDLSSTGKSIVPVPDCPVKTNECKEKMREYTGKLHE